MIKLKNVIFPESDNEVWGEWITLNSAGALLSLIKSPDIRLSIKKRAIFTIFAPPDQEFHSFDYSNTYFLNSLQNWQNNREFQLDSLKAIEKYNFLEYVADLIIEFFEILKNIKDYSHLPKLLFYRDCMIFLLKKLPQKEGEKVFNAFSLLDLRDFVLSERGHPNYAGFEKILYEQGIDKSWKIKADSIMREIINCEIADKKKRVKNTFITYFKIVTRDNLVIKDRELFVDQIKFIFDSKSAFLGKITLIEFCHIISLLSLEGNKELSLKVINYAFLNNNDFIIHNDEYLSLLRGILLEVDSKNRSLYKNISSVITNYSNQKEKAEKLQNQNNDDLEGKKQEVLLKMS